jgi:hypothetical protein
MSNKIIVLDPKKELIGHLGIGRKTNSNSKYNAVGIEETLDYFTEKCNAELKRLNVFEQACYLQVLELLEKELINENTKKNIETTE